MRTVNPFTFQGFDRLYTATHGPVAGRRQTTPRNGGSAVKTTMDTPLSRSYVSLKLSEIQKRCNELMDEPDSLIELQLEESEPVQDSGDPYNHA